MSDTTTIRGPEPADVNKPDADDIQLWSVTTIIGALDKPALVYWAADKTAQAAVNDRDVWQAMAERDPADAIDWLKKARFRTAPGERTATELGTAVHVACEEYAITGTRPDVDPDVEPFLEQFEKWCQRVQPEYQAAEVTVYSPTYGYAGTADAFLTVDGVRTIVDYKTSRETLDKRGNKRTPYPEQVALQLAAYAHAEFAAAWRPRRFEKFRRRYYLLSEAERAAAVPIPEVDAGLAIQITPDSCDAYIVEVGAEVHNAFLFVLEAFRWLSETSKTVMSDRPLEVAR